MSVIILKGNRYMWSEDYNILSSFQYRPHIYKQHHNQVYLFYMKNYHDINNIKKTLRELIAYYQLNPLPKNIGFDKKQAYRLCHFCEKYHDQKHFFIQKYDKVLILCQFCKNNHQPQNVYINHNTNLSDTFKGLVDHKLQIAVKVNQNVILFYKSIFKQISYCYINIIQEQWFQRNSTSLCEYCKNDVKYFNSMCKQCYHYSYQSSKLYNLFYISTILDKTIYSHIFYQFLMQIDINQFDFMFIYNFINNVKPIINYSLITNDITKISSSSSSFEDDCDLITEDNVDFYLEDIQQDEELGYWDDEES